MLMRSLILLLTFLSNVGAADNLPFPVVLAEDLPMLYGLLKSAKECNMAITRAKAKQVKDNLPILNTLPFFRLIGN